MSTLKTAHLRKRSLCGGLVYLIEFERESKIYFEGEEVSGEITFQTLSQEREPLKGLKTRLVGVEEIRWGDNFVESTNEFLVVDAYSPHVEYEDQEWEEDDDEEETRAANFKYKFSFNLPTKLPQSLVGSYGSVKYYVETVLNADRLHGMGGVADGSSEFSNQFRGYFEVKGILDLNTLPDVASPAYLMKDNTGGFSSLFIKNKHPVAFMFKVSKTGFVPSEVVRFTLEINNTSGHDVHGSSITLIQEIKWSGTQFSREDSKTIHTVEGPSVPAREFKSWNGSFKVPDLMVTQTPLPGHRIALKYKLRITINTSCFQENINGDLGIVIGDKFHPVNYDDFEIRRRSDSFHGPRPSSSPDKSKTHPCSHLDLARANYLF